MLCVLICRLLVVQHRLSKVFLTFMLAIPQVRLSGAACLRAADGLTKCACYDTLRPPTQCA